MAFTELSLLRYFQKSHIQFPYTLIAIPNKIHTNAAVILYCKKSNKNTMEKYLFILAFFAGVVLVFVIGYLLGKLLKLDKYKKDNINENKQ